VTRNSWPKVLNDMRFRVATVGWVEAPEGW